MRVEDKIDVSFDHSSNNERMFLKESIQLKIWNSEVMIIFWDFIGSRHVTSTCKFQFMVCFIL